MQAAPAACKLFKIYIMTIPIQSDIESLKLTLWIAGGVISLLILVVAYFLRRQIEVSETLAIAVNHLTTAVKLIEKEQAERDPRTEKRLGNHEERIGHCEDRITVMETLCYPSFIKCCGCHPECNEGSLACGGFRRLHG